SNISEAREARQMAQRFRSTTSGADGRYLIEGLEPGRYNVIAMGTRVKFEIRPGQNELDLVAEREEAKRGGVAGRVLDRSGRPLAGALVKLSREDEVQTPRGRMPLSTSSLSSLSDGSFLFSRVEPGRYQLSASARGYVARSYPGAVEVGEGPLAGLDLALERA